MGEWHLQRTKLCDQAFGVDVVDVILVVVCLPCR